MDTTQNTPAKPTAWRAILITLLIFGCGDLGFAAGIFAGVAGRLSLYNATVAGAGTFLGTLAVAIVIMIFIVKGEGG
ncbi:hypothetical protein [Streptomyces sp. NBC_00183]|uniref:hypothetical protein n=1 Tax=Streptomyces sp. NBC_00183 TaxID=2903633 RepID=UPI0022510CB5|nr:hypothetical protein [Streptomyces sp. NBC_00183]MCX5293632.1 hypothetical protein [Streptomyces sp. NBC_00183]